MQLKEEGLLKTEVNSLRSKSVKIVNLKMVREKSVHYNQSIFMPRNNIDLVRGIYQDSYREIVTVVGIDSRNYPTVIHIVSNKCNKIFTTQ